MDFSYTRGIYRFLFLHSSRLEFIIVAILYSQLWRIISTSRCLELL